MNGGDDIRILLEYLRILQDGRAKPDRNGGTVRESWDNIGEIAVVKETINNLLNLDQEKIKENGRSENNR